MPVNEPLLHNWFYGNFGVRIAASLIFSYLLGSIPIGSVVGWLFGGLDPKYARAANFVVPLLDGLKSFIATVIPSHGGGLAIGLGSGFAATIGHYFTPFQGFRGDPRIGSFAGVLAALSPPAMVSVLAFWLFASIGSRSSDIGSLFAAAIAFWPLWFFLGAPAAGFGIAAGTAVGLRLCGREIFERLDI